MRAYQMAGIYTRVGTLLYAEWQSPCQHASPFVMMT